jgi:hypothetical protein
MQAARMQLLTWNSAGLLKGSKELAHSHLLVSNKVDAAVISEAELPPGSRYTTFLSLRSTLGRHRVIVLVESALLTASNARLCKDLMASAVQTVWSELDSCDLATPAQATPETTTNILRDQATEAATSASSAMVRRSRRALLLGGI